MNNLLVENAFETRATANKFIDNFMLFTQGSDIPFAMRAPLDAEIPQPDDAAAEAIYQTELFCISKQDKNIYCTLDRIDAPRAVISVFDEKDSAATVRAAKEYFTDICSVDLSYISKREAFRTLHRIVDSVAGYCGCLTDINDPDTEVSQRFANKANTKSPYLAFALPAVCLLYRRLSALRGFNFKLIFPEDVPCLAFSARILSNGIGKLEDIAEYSALSGIDKSGGITVYARLADYPEDDGEKISVLTVVLSPQVSDPSGILRAPDWRQKTRKSLDMLDIDIPGRF